MQAFLMCVTVAACVLGNSVKNRFAKSNLKTQSDNLCFNLAGNILCIFVMAAFGGLHACHGVTIALGALFGMLNLISGLSYTLALKNGPMSLSALIILGGSLIFSTVIGTFCFGESVSVLQVIGIVLVLLSMIFISNTKVETNITAAWIVIVIIAAAFNGSLGIVQKIQGNSAYPGEQMEFLYWTFIFCCLFNIIWLFLNTKTGKKEPVTISLRGMILLSALIVGATTATQHIINLKLVAVMPAAMFFPICSGSRILLSALVDVVFFKEKLSKRQIASFILGFGAIMMLAGVFG